MVRKNTAIKERGIILGAELRALIFDLLSSFPAKNQDIIKRRFGLAGRVSETLEAIGKDYQITRERVRQIEAATLKALKGDSRKMKRLRVFEEMIEMTLRGAGGIVAEKELLVSLLGKDYQNITFRNLVLFVLYLSPRFFDLPETKKFKRTWTLRKGFFKKTRQVIETAKDILKNIGKPLTFEKLYQRIDLSPVNTSQYNEKILRNYLKVSKEVTANLYQDWGLSSWSEINPRGVKDKAYIVLQKEGRPLHFQRITNLINKSKLDKKIAHAPTVHNELIKDSRFVLVGRGIYALRDWGYRDGTVKDVIIDILRKAKKSLPREQLVNLVLKQRLVRRSTVLLNLQDLSFFEHTKNDEVRLK